MRIRNIIMVFAMFVAVCIFGGGQYASATTLPAAPITPLAVDSDGDSIADVVENTAPNNGDNNYDGAIDSDEATQGAVATTTNPNDIEKPNSYVTLQVGNPALYQDEDLIVYSNNTDWTITKFSTITASADQPNGTVFPLGLFDIELRCTGNIIDGACARSAEVCMDAISNECSSKSPANLKLIFDRVMDTTKWTTQKYDPATGQYIDYSTYVTIATEFIGYDRTTVSWVLYDGEFGDSDGQSNGYISDPIGPSVPVLQAAAVVVPTANPAATVASTVSTSQVAALAQTGVSTKMVLGFAIMLIVVGSSIFAKDLRAEN